jgi:hypothetical protein
MAALAEHGPCPEHRKSFANVIGVIRERAGLPPAAVGQEPAGDEGDVPQEPASDEAELSYG